MNNREDMTFGEAGALVFLGGFLATLFIGVIFIFKSCETEQSCYRACKEDVECIKYCREPSGVKTSVEKPMGAGAHGE